MASTKRVMLRICQDILQASQNGFSRTSTFKHPQSRNITETTNEMAGLAGKVTDTAKAGTTNMMETGREMMGEKGMHTADHAMDSAKETAQNVKDKVIETGREMMGEEDDDQVRSHQPTDGSPEDVRNRERGYD